ncbi:TPM domain-containing protein [Tenacibaculum sp. MEBiC06402]|uniref:TPM domain-containing protein n=1 Tax=unclassified Tenacibaculum TaxID=2635139 RepID=UPI003B99AE92
MNKKLNTLLIFFIGIQIALSQFDVPKKPDFQTSVYDYIGLLSESQKSRLENKLVKYSDTTSTQIVVAVISSTNNESIGVLTPRWAHKWGIGQQDKDNGVFILLAKDDRKIWISPGYGVEHKLTAGINGQLIRNVIIPEFKKGDYYSGLDKGTDAIFKVLQGEYKGTRKQSKNRKGGNFAFVVFIIILIVFFILISRGGRGKGGRRNYTDSDSRDILETIILSNAGRGGYRRSGGFGSGGFGGSSGGFGGGGFGGGFGGGGFSGGGAGGSW